jgi:hypothetical protein
LRKWSGLGSNAGAFPSPAQGQVQHIGESTGGSTAGSLVSHASALRKGANALHEPPKRPLLLSVFYDHWTPHNALRHTVEAIGLQVDLTCAGIALLTSETDSAVVSVATVMRGKITSKSLCFPLALLASGNHHHSLFSSISKASIWHRTRIEHNKNIKQVAPMR